MSQRNPLNERYQNSDERKGATRKSAASAKPVTKAASSVYIEGKAEEPKGLFAQATARANKKQAAKNSGKKQLSKQQVERRKEQALRSKYYNPDTPEYKKWKKVWWAMLGGAVATTALSFLVSGQPDIANASYVFIGISYVLLFAAIIFDFGFLRRLRNEYQETMIAQEKSKKNSERRKEAAAEARRLAAEAENEPQEERKLFRGLFTRKRAADAVATAKSAQARATESGQAAEEAAGASAASTAAADAETSQVFSKP